MAAAVKPATFNQISNNNKKQQSMTSSGQSGPGAGLLGDTLALQVVDNICEQAINRALAAPGAPQPVQVLQPHHLHLLIAAIGGIERMVFFNASNRSSTYSVPAPEIERDQGGQRGELRESTGPMDLVGFKAYLELKSQEEAEAAGLAPCLCLGEQVSRDFELSEEGGHEFQHYVKVLQEQPLEPSARIAYQVPIYEDQEEQSFSGKIQVYFKKNEDLMNRVKQQCLQKLKQTLEYLGRQASSSSLSSIIPGAPSAGDSPGRVPSLVPSSSRICLSISRDFLYFNSEVSEYVIELERRVQDLIVLELEASNSQMQQTVEHSQGYAKATGAEKIEFKIWFNNQTNKEMVRPEMRNDKTVIKQKLRNGLLNQAIEVLNKSSPNPDISVQKIKNLDPELREAVEQCQRELKVVESEKSRLYPLKSSFGNCLGHARMVMKGSSTASEKAAASRVDEAVQDQLGVFCRQIELILLKMHTAALLNQAQAQRFGQSTKSRPTRGSSQMFQTTVQPFRADIDSFQPKNELEGRPSLSSLVNVPVHKLCLEQLPSSTRHGADEQNEGSQNNLLTPFHNEHGSLSTLLDLPKQRDRRLQNSASFGTRQLAQHSQMSDDHVIIGADETEMSQRQRNQAQLQDSSASSEAEHSGDENSPSFFKSNNKKLSVIKESDNETSKLIVSDMKDVTQQSLLNRSRYQKSMNTGTMSIHDPSERQGNREVASVAVRFRQGSPEEFFLVRPHENAQSVTMADMTEQTDYQYNTIRQLLNRPSPAQTTTAKGGFATAQQRVNPASFASMGSMKSRGTSGGAKQQHGGALDKERLSDNNSNAASVGKDIADTSRKLQELLPESIQIVGKAQTSRSGVSSGRGHQYTDRSCKGGQQVVEAEVMQNKQAQGHHAPQNAPQKPTKRTSKSKPIVNQRYQKNRGDASHSGPAKTSKRDPLREKAVSSSPSTKTKRPNHQDQFRSKRDAGDQSNCKSGRSFENQDLQKAMQNGGAKSYRNFYSLNEEDSLSGCPTRLLQHTERQMVHQELRISDGQRDGGDKDNGIKTQQTAKSPNSSVALNVGNIFSIVGGGNQGHNRYHKIHTQMLGTLHSKLSHDPSQQTHFDALVAPQGGSSNLADGEEVAQQQIRQIFERNIQEREHHYLHRGDDQHARIETSVDEHLQRRDLETGHLQVSFAKSLNRGDGKEFLERNEQNDQPTQYLISPTKNTFSANIEKLQQKQMGSNKQRDAEQYSPGRREQRQPDQQAMQDQSEYTASQVRSIKQNYQSCSLSATIEVPYNQNQTRPQVLTQANAASSGFSSLVSGTPGKGSTKQKEQPLDPSATLGAQLDAKAFSSNRQAREKASDATTNTKLPRPKPSSKRNLKDPVSYLQPSKDRARLTGGTSSYNLSRDKLRHDQLSDGASASNLSRAESLIHSMNKNLKKKKSEKRSKEHRTGADADVSNSIVVPAASENCQKKMGLAERQSNGQGSKASRDRAKSGQKKQKVLVPPIIFPPIMLDKGKDLADRPVQMAKVDLGETESEYSQSIDRREDKSGNQNAYASGTNQQVTTLQQLTTAYGLRNHGALIRASQSPAAGSVLHDMTQAYEQSMEKPTPWYVSHLNNTGALKPTTGAVNQMGVKNTSLATYQSLTTQGAPAGLPYQQFDDALEKFVQILKLTTQAVEINVFSKESILIYADVEAQQLIDFTDQQKQSIAEKLADFNEEIEARKRTQEQKLTAQEVQQRKGHPEDEDLLGYTQPAFKQSKLLKDSKYKVPQSTFFKQYKSSAQSEDFNLKQALQDWNLINPPAKEQAQLSDLDGFDLVFAKIAFSVDKEEFERFQMEYEEGRKGKVQLSLAKQINNDDQYLIFQCLFNQNGLKYYPEMFINICQNFLIADDQLRNEIENLLSITSKIQLGSPRPAAKRAPTPPSNDLNTNRGLQSSRTQAQGAPSQPKHIVNSVVYADTLEEEQEAAARRDQLDDEEDVESINEEYTVQSESLEALGKQRKASSQAQQVTASASAACRGNSLKGSSVLSREQRSWFPSKVNESFVDMKLQDSPLQNSVQKPAQTTRHVPQKSSDYQNSRMKQEQKLVLFNGKSNFARMPAALVELSSLKHRPHGRVSGGFVAQMGKSNDIYDIDALREQATGSRMMQDKSQRTVSACTEALPQNLAQALTDGVHSQGSKVLIQNTAVVSKHGKSASVVNNPDSNQDTSRHGAGGGRRPSERPQEEMASRVETPSKPGEPGLHGDKNGAGTSNPYSTSIVADGQKPRRPMLGRLNLNDSPPSKPVIAHAQSAKVLNFRAGFNQHKYSQSAIQQDLRKLTREPKADGKNREQEMAYGDNQSTKNVNSQAGFESSGVFGLSPNVKRSQVNKTQNSSLTSNSATFRRQSPGIKQEAESENQKFNIQVLSPSKNQRFQHGTEPMQRGLRKIGVKETSLDKKGLFVNSSFSIHQSSAQHQNRKKNDSYISYTDTIHAKHELNASSEPDYSRSQPHAGLVAAQKGAQLNDPWNRGAKKIKDSDAKDRGSLSFSFGDINSKMKTSAQFANALNSLSSARRMMQGSPSKQGSGPPSILLPDKRRSQKGLKSTDAKPILK